MVPLLLIAAYSIVHLVRQATTQQRSQQLTQVEVLNQEPAYMITRLQAKRNLATLISSQDMQTSSSPETIATNFHLFDRRWYMYREQQIVDRKRQQI